MRACRSPSKRATRATDSAFWERTIGKREQRRGDFEQAQALMLSSGADEERQIRRAQAREQQLPLHIQLELFDAQILL